MNNHRIILTAILVLFAGGLSHSTSTARTHDSSNDILIVVWKYDGAATLMIRNQFDRYEAVEYGKIWRTFPAGSKTSIIGDGRLPEGIFPLHLTDNEGSTQLGFTFETIPGTFERYTVKGRTLDRNSISLDDAFLQRIHQQIGDPTAVEVPRITLVILPGNIPVEMRERLKASRNVQPWATEEALDDSIRRLKPLEDYLTIVKRIPQHYSFDDDGTWIIHDTPAAEVQEAHFAGK
ncbi:MAG: hypothetical protein M5R41_16935 [Bacteroidia bacterium]|nr:hypothetical protein [Bacteroidia bacterium]